MGFKWRTLKIPRFYGLDLKTNVIDVKDGYSLDCENVYQNKHGVISKRKGNETAFASDETGSLAIDEIGSATLAGTKYWFKFTDGDFKYSTSRTGALTSISPTPAISTTNRIFYVALDDKLFFVDGTNDLRYFNGSAISASSIYARPTAAPTSGSGAGTFDYIYTVDNGLGESPASPALSSIVSAGTIRVPGNTGPQTLVAGNTVRIYSRSNAVVAASKLVATHTWSAGNVAAGFADIVTVAISDTQTQLYSELGVALNKSAPTALVGITEHYGRLVGWKDDSVYNSKSSNPHSWPDDSAQKEAFVYGFGVGDGEGVQNCTSYRESLFVFKKTKVAVFGGIGPDDTGNNAYSFRRLETNGIGCIAPKSVAVIGEEKKNYLIFLSQQGFYATNGDSPIRIGEKIEPEIQTLSTTTLSAAVAIHHKREGTYLCSLGSDSAKTIWVLDVREDDGKLFGWFEFVDVNAKCLAWDDDRYIFGTAQGFCGSERVAGTFADFSDIQIEYIATAAINTGTEEITVTNSYQTGDQVVVRTNGTIPAGLTANVVYYVIRVSATVIKLAASSADASAGTAINITSQGVGTHSIVGSKAINAYYTTNWINYGSPSYVKKLAKPSVVFNAVSDSVVVTQTQAYDWVEIFTDSSTITIGSNHLWGTGTWGSFVWAAGTNATPKNIAIPRRKVRSIRYKWVNNSINQDFNIQALEMQFDIIRNRGNFA